MAVRGFSNEYKMKASDLRIGNIVKNKDGEVFPISEQDLFNFALGSEEFFPVEITEEWLLKEAKAYKMPFPTITNSIIIDLGRKRILSIGNLGTSNEMVWLCQKNKFDDKKIDDLVCIRNYDYDGGITTHEYQNLYHSLTQTELQLKTKLCSKIIEE